MNLIETQAMQLAWSLGIKLYLRDNGTIAQRPPGKLIDPGPRAGPIGMHGDKSEPEKEGL